MQVLQEDRGKVKECSPCLKTPLWLTSFITNLYSRKQDIEVFPESGFKTVISLANLSITAFGDSLKYSYPPLFTVNLVSLWPNEQSIHIQGPF